MWSVDDAQIAGRRATSPGPADPAVAEDDASPWDQLPSSLVEPDLTVLDLTASGPETTVVDPVQVYADFWGEARLPVSTRRRRWARRRAWMG